MNGRVSISCPGCRAAINVSGGCMTCLNCRSKDTLIAALRRDLDKYGRHTNECSLLILTPVGKPLELHDCDCGLDKALTSFPQEEA